MLDKESFERIKEQVASMNIMEQQILIKGISDLVLFNEHDMRRMTMMKVLDSIDKAINGEEDFDGGYQE